MVKNNRGLLKFFMCVSLLTLGVASSLSAGVASDTVVLTPEGLKQIGLLKVGDTVVSLNKELLPENRPVMAIKEVEANTVFDITTEDGMVIRVSQDQRFFVANKWVKADKLAVGDVLFKRDQTTVKIVGICQKQEAVKFCFITVQGHHNFLVTQNGVLVHNGIGGATFGVYFGKFAVHFVAHATILAVAAMTGPLAPATVVSLEATFLPTIEAASHVGALVGGIVCATATGPV